MLSRPLIELDPWWITEGGRRVGICFKCPVDDDRCFVGAAFEEGNFARGRVWKHSGDTFLDLSLEPSLDASVSGFCTFHGTIRNGMVSW